MEPKQAWGAFSIMVILADAVFVSAMIDLGYEPALVVAAALIALLVYFYVLYKRYHVEVVPENDIVQFQDPDDLRILCSIYGLETKGTELELRRRLVDFANSQGDRAFIWVAPRVVQSVGSALEIPQTQNTRHEGSANDSVQIPASAGTWENMLPAVGHIVMVAAARNAGLDVVTKQTNCFFRSSAECAYGLVPRALSKQHFVNSL